MKNVDFIRAAYKFAKENSNDPATQTGCVIVNDDIVVVSGANTFPVGIENTPLRCERPTKYDYIEHAERNAIYRAARRGIRTNGLVMYSPWFPCVECCRAIIQAGIKKLVCHKQTMELGNKKWSDSLKLAQALLEESDVELEIYDGPVGSVSIIFNEKVYSP